VVFALVAIGLVCLIGLAAAAPTVACVFWVLALETSPDEWLSYLIGAHETIIAVIKAAGLVLAGLLMLRFGARADRANPGFAFMWMFVTGLLHGLYPGLGLLASVRSLAGSAAPFAFGFARLPADWCRAVIRAVTLGPLFTVVFGAGLAALHIYPLYAFVQGAVRLGGSGQSPFLADFALIAIYAGLLEGVRRGRGGSLILLNLTILVLTGGRAALALATILVVGTLLAQRRLMALAAAGAVGCAVVMFAGALRFVRVVDLVQLGEATDLSNRDLVWPVFARAFAASPWFGWGVGAGKVVIPPQTGVAALVGSNAAHDEYLRIATEGGVIGLGLLIGLLAVWVARGTRGLPAAERWLMRAVFCAFAVHSATDNTLIATTSSVFFIWVSAVFASGAEAAKAPA
jgi:hypothetical protein